MIVCCHKPRRRKNRSDRTDDDSDASSCGSDSDSEDEEYFIDEVTTERSRTAFPFFGGQWCRGDEPSDSEDSDGASTRRSRTPKPSKSPSRSSKSPSFRKDVDGFPPARPAGTTDLIVDGQPVPGVTVGQVTKAVTEDSVIMGYLTHFSQAKDIVLTGWCDVGGGVQARRAQFTMPVPQEVPAAIARLVQVPASSRATLILGYHKPSADELLVYIQQCTHDVPYGESFRVNEVMAFRPAGASGCTFSKWTSVRWLQALPWLVSPMKPITESKTRSGSQAGSVAFLRMLREAAGCVDASPGGRRIASLKELHP